MYNLRTNQGPGNRGGLAFSEHSAIKALPLGETKPIFERVVEKGALNERE